MQYTKNKIIFSHYVFKCKICNKRTGFCFPCHTCKIRNVEKVMVDIKDVEFAILRETTDDDLSFDIYTKESHELSFGCGPTTGLNYYRLKNDGTVEHFFNLQQFIKLTPKYKFNEIMNLPRFKPQKWLMNTPQWRIQKSEIQTLDDEINEIII